MKAWGIALLVYLAVVISVTEQPGPSFPYKFSLVLTVAILCLLPRGAK